MCVGYGPALWGWWWIIPLAGFILCMSMCLFFRRRTPGRHLCRRNGIAYADFESMQKELRDLKETVDKMKEK